MSIEPVEGVTLEWALGICVTVCIATVGWVLSFKDALNKKIDDNYNAGVSKVEACYAVAMDKVDQAKLAATRGDEQLWTAFREEQSRGQTFREHVAGNMVTKNDLQNAERNILNAVTASKVQRTN